MDRKTINPLGKTFYFNLDEYSCCKLKAGICPLEVMIVEEIKKLPKKKNFFIEENSWEYCSELAKRIIELDDDENCDFTHSIWLYYNEKCNHYSLADGQHRTCIIAQLYQKGVRVKYNPHFSKQNEKCRKCLYIDDALKLKKQVNFLDKLFKTKKYKKYIRLIKLSQKTTLRTFI